MCSYFAKNPRVTGNRKKWHVLHGDDTVDGSEIPFPTAWDGAKTLRKIMGFQLPVPQLVSHAGVLNHQQDGDEV